MSDTSDPRGEFPHEEQPAAEQAGASPSGGTAPAAPGPAGAEGNAPEEAAAAPALTEDHVREQLKQVIDPELFVNIVDLGLVYVVDLQPNDQTGKTDIHVEMTLTSPMCPAGPQLVGSSRQVLESIPGVGEVDIKVVMDPPWTQDMMTEDARDQLNIF
ncbi:MAG: metal-sulfur cluster assembly factor [Planctomycetota bacterium]|nr:MAG: metal-sulfur cluster assembly factor [Planctomycetota bacterium]